MRPKIQVKYDFALGNIDAGQGKPTETLAGASRQEAENTIEPEKHDITLVIQQSAQGIRFKNSRKCMCLGHAPRHASATIISFPVVVDISLWGKIAP